MPHLTWYLCSVISGDDCALDSFSTVSCSNEFPLSFNPCIGGEGFQSSDPIVSSKGRADRRVLSSELLTALWLLWLKAHWVSRSLSPSHFPLKRYHFSLPPHLTYRKNSEGCIRDQTGHISNIQKQWDPAKIKVWDGKKHTPLLLGHAPNKGKTENFSGKAGFWFEDISILLVLPQVTLCKRKN